MEGTIADALATGELVVLDGGLATTLAARGHDLSGALWSARLLIEDAAAIRDVHRAFLGAGAQVVTTASYQVAARSLSAAGHDPDVAPVLLARSVELAREAIADHAAAGGGAGLVAASVGPLGAVLGGGAEYRGGYGLSVAELRAYHAPRLDALLSAGPDLLACETLPSGAEVAALAQLVAGTHVPTWVSLTPGADATTPEGQPLVDALRPALDVDEVVAVGVNCCLPDTATRALSVLAALDRPLVVYPNIGERWDGTRWTPSGDLPDPRPWVTAGAQLIGGCCGTGPDDLARLRAHLG